MTSSPFASGPLPPPPAGRQGWPWIEAAPPAVTATSRHWPRITLITPSFNQAAYLEATIRSVLLQGYPNLQYIVIDGGSTDGSVDIIRRYAPWLDHWVSEPDRGQSHAINKGLARANGLWCNWLNSDDYLLPGALERIAAVAAEAPAARLIAGRLRQLHNSGNLLPAPSVKLTGDAADDLVNHRMAQPAMFYHRDCLPQVDETLHLAMDFDLWMRFMAAYGAPAARLIDDPVAVFRLHPAAKTTVQAAGFEAEERRVLRHVFEALRAESALLDALAPASPHQPVILGTPLSLAQLTRAVVRRYLLGDLRRAFHRGFGAAEFRLLRLCLRHDPVMASATAAKAWIKRLLRRPLDA